MTPFFEYFWLIPVFPLIGASFLAVLLISFSRTMNRLSKPVLAVTSICSLISCLFSYYLSYYEFNNREATFNYDLTNLISLPSFHLTLFADFYTSIELSVALTLIMLSIFVVHGKKYRKQGYVRSFVLIGFLSSFLSFLIMSTPINSLSL